MNIHVFGRGFKDILIYGGDIHVSRVFEDAGGSAVNASVALSNLGFETYIHSCLGNDRNGDYILEVLNTSGVNLRYLQRNMNETNLFVSRNNRPLAVNLNGENDLLNMNFEYTSDDICLMFATETDERLQSEIMDKNWAFVYVDLGPAYRNRSFERIRDHMIVIGNEAEAVNSECNIVKKGVNGALWDGIFVPGNGKKLPYTVGSGDLFDAFFIYSRYHFNDKREILNFCVTKSEEVSLIPGSSKKSLNLKINGTDS
ncbi:MAG TPA: carbohydrate kinase family protein [Thermotogota bacterium]|nr:carbohydrate kinase family protein [Thermotogota bacterium]HPJ87604.1 carbohydrate kinase family protein [Thermotogota bacterium]HPR94809.1 carbohydrate kinase family protein [Thermotogota bacterium]